MPTLTTQTIHSNKKIRSIQPGVLLAIAAMALACTCGADAQSTQAQSTQTNSSISSSVSSSVDAPTLTAYAGQAPTLYGGSSQNGPYARPSSVKAVDTDFNKYSFAAGFGFNVPAGDTEKYQNTGWNLQIAGGRNLNKMFGAQLEYDYNHSNIPGYIVNNLNPGGGGDVHLWSFSVDPYVNLPVRGRIGAYVIGGGGFYRKLTEFTQPYCGYDYYGYYYCSNTPVAHWSNNAFGANAGLGLTWKLSRWNSAKFYAEGRYVWVNNQASANNTSANGYPPANYRTGYFPVVFGIRF